jgi:crotonobetainyl-CoA:carnitine CoA-transferase CaiB-like acyl-CoA transferase
VKGWKTVDLLAALKQADVPHGEATALDDLADDPHLEAVGFFQTHDHPSEGRIKLTTPPMKFSQTPIGVNRLPATLGEHSVEILREAGYSDAQISDMLGDGVSVDGRH